MEGISETCQRQTYDRRTMVQMVFLLATSAVISSCIPDGLLPSETPSETQEPLVPPESKKIIRDVFTDLTAVGDHWYDTIIPIVSDSQRQGSFQSRNGVEISYEVQDIEVEDVGGEIQEMKVSFDGSKFCVSVKADFDPPEGTDVSREDSFEKRIITESFAIHESIHLLTILESVSRIAATIDAQREGLDFGEVCTQIGQMIQEAGDVYRVEREFLPTLFMSLFTKYALEQKGMHVELLKVGLKSTEDGKSLEGTFAVPVYIAEDQELTWGLAGTAETVSIFSWYPGTSDGLDLTGQTWEEILNALAARVDAKEGVPVLFGSFQSMLPVYSRANFPKASLYPELESLWEFQKRIGEAKILRMIEEDCRNLGQIIFAEGNIFNVTDGVSKVDEDGQVRPDDDQRTFTLYTRGGSIYFIAHDYREAGQFIKKLTEGNTFAWALRGQTYSYVVCGDRDLEVGEDMHTFDQLAEQVKINFGEDCLKVIFITCNGLPYRQRFTDGKEGDLPESYHVVTAKFDLKVT